MRNPSGKCKPISISRRLLQQRALLEAKRLNLDQFKASDGWFANWRWRFGIGHSSLLHGEAGEVDIEEMEPKIEILRQLILAGCYDVDCIFNMDETGLFYRCLPRKS